MYSIHYCVHCAANTVQIKALRRKFELLDDDSDGILSKYDFCKMLESVGIYLTAQEIDLIRQR
jgi:Ca2+-binding EF-hand superfamily protein